jgi:GT2 family glycosyltransferase/nucleoside-diphosphate-sugar epimerase
MKTCSVVTVTYYTGPVLFAALKTVLRQKQLAELIVVDNGNPPEVLTRLQQMALTEPRLIIITGHGNVGFGTGCNLGAEKITGEYMLLLNPDCLLPPDALANMITGFESFPGAMLAGCRLDNPDGSEQRGGRRSLLTPLTAINEVLGLHKLLRLNLHDTPMPEEPFELLATSGAFMFIKRSDYEQLHGFDEGFFLHVEDLDFCMRVHNAGGKVICIPSVRVTHLTTSSMVTTRFLEWHKAKGFRRYFDKHFRGKCIPGFLALIHMAIMVRFAYRITIGEFKKRLCNPAKAQMLASKRLMTLASGLVELQESSAMKGKTVLVTGATGQVGVCVLRRLLAVGANVLALSRSDGIPFRHERLLWIKGDLNDKSMHLTEYHVDTVVHCVPLWRPLPAMGVLTDTGAKRVIAFSSTSIFAKALSKNEFEKAVVRQLTQSESALTSGCREHGIALTILRPTLIYGVGLDANVTVLAEFIRRFGFFPIYPPAFGRRQPVHADDLAIAVLNIMDNEKTYGKAYNVSGGEVITYRSMLEKIFTALGRKPRIIPTTSLPSAFDIAGMLLRKKDINGEIARRMNDDLIFFHDEATRDFSFFPRSFLSGGVWDIDGF